MGGRRRSISRGRGFSWDGNRGSWSMGAVGGRTGIRGPGSAVGGLLCGGRAKDIGAWDRHQDEGESIQTTSRSLQVSMPIVSGSPILLVLLSQEAATRERAL